MGLFAVDKYSLYSGESQYSQYFGTIVSGKSQRGVRLNMEMSR